MNIRNLLIATAAMSALAGAASAQITQTVPVKAVIQTPAKIEAVEGTQLDFGTLSRTGTPESTVTVGASGATSGVAGFTLAGGTPAAAQFVVTGYEGQTIGITATMATVLNTDINVTPAVVGGASQPIPEDGTLELEVGGTLTIDEGVAVQANNYAGTMTVNITYN